MKNLSLREKILAIAVCAVLVFFAYWTFALDPVISSIADVKNDNDQLRTQIDEFTALKKAGLPAAGRDISIHPKEEQLAMMVGFLENQMKENKIKMLSLKQVSADSKISIDLEIEGSYSNHVLFFDAMSKLDTVFDVDAVSMSNQNKNVLTKIRILTPFL